MPATGHAPNGTLWKFIATSMLSIVLTLIVAWVAFGGGVTAEAAAATVRQKIEDHAATVHGKSVPRTEFDLIREDIRDLRDTVELLRAEIIRGKQ